MGTGSQLSKAGKSPVPRSMERRLRSSTALTVLGGYALFLLFGSAYYRQSLSQSHEQLRAQVLQVLQQQGGGSRELESAIHRLIIPNGQLWLRRGGISQPIHLVSIGDRMVSESSDILPVHDGTQRSLVLQVDVSEALARQTLTLQLFSIAAGMSALLTALLMRPLLHRGVVIPLRRLSDQLSAYISPGSPPPPLIPESQPVELQDIARSFNAMQERLRASWEQQRAFADTVAHELRTPITLISGHAQSLQRQGSTINLAPTLALIHKEAQRMASLVSDMLDLARMDAGRLELRLMPIDVDDLLLEVYERLSPTAAGRMRLRPPAVEHSLPLALGDPERLSQCLLALVDNALRYSPSPTPIHVWATSTTSADVTGEEAAGATAVVIHVLDQGPGVPPSERQTIFERFVRGSTALNTRGSGIGLAVVQELMQAMHGRVVVADGPGGGADMQLWLTRFAASADPGINGADPPGS